VAEEEEAEEAEGPRLEMATGPIYQFYHKSAKKDDFGIKQPYWRRLLSPYTPFVYHDLQDPSIQYPSLEAAWHGSRVGITSSKPSARIGMFSVESKIHQTAEAERGGAKFNPDDMESYLEEGKQYYDQISTEQKLKRAGIVFNKDLWKERKEQVLIDLVKQRFERDPIFRTIIEAIKSNKTKLFYYSLAAKDNDLAGSQAGDTIKGDNLLGRAIMYFAGLTY
jgi:predicted NAD-dependent protein-ADP-ribosyltransferase YbiA (DUF1768 family)